MEQIGPNHGKQKYEAMTTAELEQLSSRYAHEEHLIMKELLRRNPGVNLLDDLQPADMIPTEDDF